MAQGCSLVQELWGPEGEEASRARGAVSQRVLQSWTGHQMRKGGENQGVLRNPQCAGCR